MLHTKEQLEEAKQKFEFQQEAQAGEAFYAVSTPSKYPVGLEYRGSYETEWAGVQGSVRRHARALSKTGMPVWLISQGHRMQYYNERGVLVDGFADHTQLSDSVRQEVGHLLECNHAQTLVRVEHRIFTADALGPVVYPPRISHLGMGARQRLNANTVVYTVFERSELDEEIQHIAMILRSVAEVWVPCERNRRLLVEAGMPEQSVVRVPHPLSPNDPVWQHRRHHRDRKVGPIRVMHVGKWEPRKAGDELIGGFLLAFGPGEAQLLIKTHSFGKWPGYPDTPQDSALKWLSDPAVVDRGWTVESARNALFFTDRHMPRERLIATMADSDIYVSSGRSEGFDMPALDAKILGLRLVVMGHGGAEDFCTPRDVRWQSAPVPVHPSYGWKDATWAGFSVSDFANALRTAADLPSSPNDFDPSPYTESVVGQLMLDRCLAIIRRVSPDFEFCPVEEYLNA